MGVQVELPKYESTAADVIPRACQQARKTFRCNRTKDVQYRLVQLRKLYWALTDWTRQLTAALKSDLGKSEYEAVLTEIDWCKGDCQFMIDNLERWAKDDRAQDVPLTFAMMNYRIKKEPLGAVLVISTYNYPVQLLIGPLIGAISAGCTAVVKPSENAPATAMVLTQLIQDRLDPASYLVVNGGVPETTALLDEKWDKIFYTGSAAVGTIIAKKAAETLTPVCLELGGRNPAFVTKNANLKLAARRLMWGKTLNAGQVCMSHNYVLVDKSVADEFVQHLNASYKDMFPNGAKASPDLSRIINQRQFSRMRKMVDESKGRIVMGGEMDENELYIEPTAVLVDSMADPMVQEETFGPIFSLLPYNTLDEAIDTANSVHRTPLSMSTFGSKAENDRVLNEVNSGGATLNDAWFHGCVPTVPFGGVGDSGSGSYRGKASFDCFTHFRTVSETPGWMDKLLRVRYMPYSWKELKQLNALTGKRPDFDRNGKPTKGLGYWLTFVLTLGSSSGKGALVRWLFVLATYAMLTGKKVPKVQVKFE